MKPLLVGEAPSKSGADCYEFPLSGALGRRLATWARIPAEGRGSYGDYYWALRERFDCVNAIERYEDSVPWRRAVARDRIAAYLDEFPTDVIVALGLKAADSLGVRRVTWGAWEYVNERWVAVAPHPSSRNLLLNDPGMRELVGRVLRESLDWLAQSHQRP